MPNGQSLFSGPKVPATGPQIIIKTLRSGESVEGYLLTENGTSFEVHWNSNKGKKGRSERCLGEEQECPGCFAGLPKRWKGYLPIVDAKNRSTIILELTPGTALSLNDLIGGYENRIGLFLRFSRQPGGDRTRIRVQLLNQFPVSAKMPEPPNVQEALEKLWKWPV